MRWVSVKKYMPPKNAESLIIRAIDEECDVFYLQGIYSYEDDEWQYNSDEDLQVTHWARPDDVEEEDIFEEDEE